MADEEDVDVEDSSSGKTSIKPGRPARKANKAATLKQIISKNEKNALVRRVSNILRKADSERTKEDVAVLTSSPELADRLKKQAIKRHAVKQRVQEIEDTPAVMEEKCRKLAAAIKHSNSAVIYTGAGISTAASIPDYRGPNGVWTLLQKGQQPEAQELSDAEPTLTHMCIAKLYSESHVKYVVSQNCDGLHIRSGLPRQVISEVHGNMYLEICTNCKPQKDYIRLFDVTEKTGVRRHLTDRNCHMCGKRLRDTIVHFGEKGGLKSPYRWKQAAKAADDCDIIICLGTSLKILKKYSCLWCMDRRLKQRPDLYIVNLQWTPKDEVATLKINGRCDDVLKRVMEILNLPIPTYRRDEDAIFMMAVPLKPSEYSTTAKKILSTPKHVRKRKRKKMVQDFERCPPNQDTKEVKIASDRFEQNGPVLNRLTELKSMHPSLTSQLENPIQSSPLDLSGSSQPYLTNDFAKIWSLDLFNIMVANQRLAMASQQHQDIAHQRLVMASQQHQDMCMTCFANRRLGEMCKCSSSNSVGSGLTIPGMNNLLPFQAHLQLMRNLYFTNPQLCSPFPGLMPYLPSVFQHVQKFDSVLRDHNYLTKHQMQQLSPKQKTRKEEATSSKPSCQNVPKQKVKVETATSPVKSSISFLKDSDLKVKLDADDNTHIQTRCKLERSISQDDRPPEALTPSKSEDLSETESECSSSKKPKLSRSVSVPGWFGKGLNVRKKKR